MAKKKSTGTTLSSPEAKQWWDTVGSKYKDKADDYIVMKAKLAYGQSFNKAKYAEYISNNQVKTVRQKVFQVWLSQK